MKNTNLLYSTLVATALSLSPFLITPLDAIVSQSTKTLRLSYSVAESLYNRGIDADVAKKMANDFFKGDEELFSVLLENVENRCSVLKENEIMDYISTLALQRKTIDLSSYSALVNMLHKIKHTPPSKKTLIELQNIANLNKAIV